MKVGDLIKHRWNKMLGVVIRKPNPARQPPPNNWRVLFNNGRRLVHEDQRVIGVINV